jgi:hypothetical protein
MKFNLSISYFGYHKAFLSSKIPDMLFELLKRQESVLTLPLLKVILGG